MKKFKGNLTQDFVYWAHTNTKPVEYVNMSTTGCYESIAYEQPQFERFGDCSHHKVVVKLKPDAVAAGSVDTSNCVWGFQYYPPRPVDLDAVDDAFNARAFQAMKPQIAPVVQAPVELREFITGWKALLKPFRSGSNIASKVGSTNLWWQFGVAPTIGAVQDVIKGLEDFEQRLRDFLEHQGKPLTTHYREVEVVPAETLIRINSTVLPHRWSVVEKHEEYEVTRVATMSYSYTIVGIDDLSKEQVWLRAMGDLLGASRSLAMLWESTPWSFIVDWFFTVGDFLEQFDKPFLDTAVVVKDYCISAKATLNGSHWMSRDFSGLVCGGTWCITTYQRTRCLPNYSNFGIRESGNFGIRQFFLGLSLLVA